MTQKFQKGNWYMEESEWMYLEEEEESDWLWLNEWLPFFHKISTSNFQNFSWSLKGATPYKSKKYLKKNHNSLVKGKIEIYLPQLYQNDFYRISQKKK